MRRRFTIAARLEEHPIHVVVDWILRCTLASPLRPDSGARLCGARLAGPPPRVTDQPVRVRRRVSDHHGLPRTKTGEVRRSKANGRTGRSAWKVSSII
jgi:hypothetical protein